MRVLLVLLLASGCADVVNKLANTHTDDDCRDAVKHVEACCAGFKSAQVQCWYETNSESKSAPDLTSGQSRCIQNVDCSAMRARVADGDLCGLESSRYFNHSACDGKAGPVPRAAPERTGE